MRRDVDNLHRLIAEHESWMKNLSGVLGQFEGRFRVFASNLAELKRQAVLGALLKRA